MDDCLGDFVETAVFMIRRHRFPRRLSAEGAIDMGEGLGRI